MKSFSLHILLVVILLGMSFDSYSQGRNKYDRFITQDIGFSVGTAYYLGEINPRKHFGTKLTPAYGALYRINLDTRWAVRLGLMKGTVEATDADSNDPWQQNRNLSFKNDIIEGSLLFELNFFNYMINQSKKYTPVSPYFFAGVAYYKMNPQGYFNSTWYELQPLGTEGQGTTEGGNHYKLTGISIPFGIGIKANVYSIIGVSVEWGMRKTWTDYFDDVSGIYPDQVSLENESGDLAVYFSDQSLQPIRTDGTNSGVQRGDPGRKDWYAFAQFTLSIRLTKRKGTCWKG